MYKLIAMYKLPLPPNNPLTKLLPFIVVWQFTDVFSKKIKRNFPFCK